MLKTRKYISILGLLAVVVSCGPKEPVTVPTISVSSAVTVREGDADSKQVSFKVKVFGSFSEEGNPSVNYSLRHITTTDDDLVTKSGTLNFTFEGEELTVTTEVLGDEIYEPNKEFELRISEAANAKINSFGRSQKGTLIDNDPCLPGDCEGYVNVESYSGMTLEWSDEFDGQILDRDIWDYDIGAGGWWNAQLQYFTTSSANSFIEDGNLIIRTKQIGPDITSAQIKTQGKKFINKGRLDIRAKFPGGKGVWPRIWLKPEDNVHGAWPQSGEMIMAEIYGHSPSIVHTLADYGKDGNDMERHSFSYSADDHKSMTDVYHTYSLIWQDGRISMLVDEDKYMTLTKEEVQAQGYVYPYTANFHVIFSLAIGGTKVGNPDYSLLPVEMKIDYIRFYKSN